MIRSRSAAAVAAVVVAATLAASLPGCAGMRDPNAPQGAAVIGLGENFRTTHGEVFVMRVQDEFRMIRCIPTGPIAGCYEDVFRIERASITDDSLDADAVRWNRWVPVPQMPGVEIMFLTPDRMAMREVPATATLR